MIEIQHKNVWKSPLLYILAHSRFIDIRLNVTYLVQVFSLWGVTPENENLKNKHHPYFDSMCTSQHEFNAMGIFFSIESFDCRTLYVDELVNMTFLTNN